MARTIRDAKLETRAARLRLTPSKKPYWKTLEPGKLHLGYRKKKKDTPGQWLVRHYKGWRTERYIIAPLGLADDYSDEAMSYAEAQRLAHEHRIDAYGRKGKDITVADALRDYIEWAKDNTATGPGMERRAALHILPTLGKVKVTKLTTQQLTDWRDALAARPALFRPKTGQQHKTKPAPKTKDEQRARRVTANKSVTILKAALNHAFHADRVADDKTWRKFKSFPTLISPVNEHSRFRRRSASSMLLTGQAAFVTLFMRHC